MTTRPTSDAVAALNVTGDIDLAPYATRARQGWPTSHDLLDLVDEVRRIRQVRDAAIALYGKASGDRAVAKELLADLTDPDPCWFDHHGYCQAHWWMETDPECPHERAKRVLNAADGAHQQQTGGETP